MTNSQIIFQERTKLLKAGLIKGTGKFITMVVINAEGKEEEKQFEVPEELHTYASWKKLGYKVKNGTCAYNRHNNGGLRMPLCYIQAGT